MNQPPNENTFTVESIVVPNVKSNKLLPPIKTIESIELPEIIKKNNHSITEAQYPHTAVQNNNQFYNNQQYIQFVYPPQSEQYNRLKLDYNYSQEREQLSAINRSNKNTNTNDLKNTSKFIKIAKKNYEQDRNLNFSLLHSKYANRSYSENEEEEYIYLYKENGTPPKRNETPETARIEIFNLNNQCNILKSENFFLNQKVYDLSMEIVRLQKLNMQFSSLFPQGKDYLNQKQADEIFSYEPTYDVSRVKNKIMPSADGNFNMSEFIDYTITEFNKLE